MISLNVTKWSVVGYGARADVIRIIFATSITIIRQKTHLGLSMTSDPYLTIIFHHRGL